MKRTTVFLPDDLHERLRREAFQTKVSMASLIRTKLEVRPVLKRPKRSTDPLLRVAGIYRGPVISNNIDEELYGI